jgi:hypothetical protein
VYGQCGGIGWTGSTTCCTGSTCVYQGPYYSQCTSIPGVSSSSSSTVSTTTVASGNNSTVAGVTTRNWDCCKPSCGWPGIANVTSPVQTCAQDGITAVDANTDSICTGGSAYFCNNQQPWSVNDSLSYGYASTYLAVSKSFFDTNAYIIIRVNPSPHGVVLVIHSYSLQVQ